MSKKIIKIFLSKGTKSLFFLFLSIFFSLFSYIFGENLVGGVREYITSESKPLLGGDFVISGKNSLDEEKFHEKYPGKFEISKTLSMYSTLFDKNHKTHLVELVYHTPNFPFYQQFEYDILNQNGDIILDSESYRIFGDEIEIFGEKLLVKGIIKNSFIQNISLYASQKTLYIPFEKRDISLDSTNSRLEYKYYALFRGKYDESQIDILKNDDFFTGFSIQSLQDRNDFLSDITDRFFIFLSFFHFIIFLLVFFVVILSLETFFKKLKKTIGLLYLLGMKKRKIFMVIGVITFMIFFVGFLLASILNIGIFHILSGYIDFLGPKKESIFGGFLVFLILFGVGYFLIFYKISLSQIKNFLGAGSDFEYFKLRDYFLYLGIVGVGFFFILLTGGFEVEKSILLSGGIIVGIIGSFLGIGSLLKILFVKIKPKDFYIFDAMRSTLRPGNTSFLIVFSSMISFLGVFVFLVFSLSFIDFLQNLTKTSNDTFIINVQPKDMEKIDPYFSKEEIFEIVSLKITQINGVLLNDYLNTKNTPNQFSREFFSTTSDTDAKIISGKPLSAGGVSVDREFAKNLGVQIGDEITFSLAGIKKTLQIVNLREAKRNGANPFFFFQLYSKDFVDFPKSYILSYKSSQKPQNIENILGENVGNHLTFIKVGEMIEIILSIVKNIFIVVYIALGYIFLFSILTFYSSLEFLKGFQLQKLSIMSFLGGKLSKLRFGLKFEMSYLFTLGCIISIGIGSVILFGIFHLNSFFVLNIFQYILGLLGVIIMLVFMNILLYFWKIKK